jgi:hypothetical protein
MVEKTVTVAVSVGASDSPLVAMDALGIAVTSPINAADWHPVKKIRNSTDNLKTS